MAKTIDDYKKDYADARARGDAAGMQAANDGANAIRRSQGVAEEKATADIALVSSQNKSGGVALSGAGGSTTGTSPSFAPTTQQVLSLGQGPLSQEGYERKVSSAVSSGGGVPLVSSSPTASQDSGQTQKQAADYDLTEYLRQQKAAEVETTLAGLKDAYTKAMADYDATLDKLPETYQAARNDAAAQTAIAQRNFNERAAASGLNSGASGQAALDMSAGYRGALAQLNQQQANQAAEIDQAKTTLSAQYETAIAQAKAEGDAALADALYQELIRVQEMEREDEQTAYDRYVAEIERQTAAENTAWTQSYNERVLQNQIDQQAVENQRAEAALATEREQTEYNRKLQAAQIMAQFGRFDGYATLWNLSEADTEALVTAYAEQERLSKEQAARDLADWYAQYGDFSALRALNVDTSALEAQYAAARRKTATAAPSTGSAVPSEASAQNMAAVKQTIALAANAGKDIQLLLDTVWDSGQYSNAQKQEILNYARAMGYST